ncbi:MAG: PASTA domain-containing protein [Ruminococcus sp.]
MSLCIGCMQEIGSNQVCPNCGFDNTKTQSAPFLPYRTVLNNRYIVGTGIDNNGESTRYLGFDKHTGEIVIVCEFLPIGLFDRQYNEKEVRVSFENEAVYNKLKKQFISYYSTLSQMKDLSALLKIHDVFTENNTAYVIEENEDLIPFEEYVKRSNGHLDWDIARPLFMPVISALEAMHKKGIGHYALSPRNMYVTAAGKIKITGFATQNERKRGTELKSQLFGGCAAPEQYLDNFPLDNITDIYGFCATLFYALTGHLPNNAQERLKDSRLLMSTNTVKRLPPHVVTALANGLQVKRENRITDFDDLRSQLSLAPTVQAIQEEISRTASLNKIKDDEKKGMSHFSIGVLSAAITAVVLGVIGILIFLQNPFASLFNGDMSNQETTENQEWTGPTVPDYVGKVYNDIDQASDTNVKFYRAFEDEYSDQYPEGQVMKQFPPAGSPVNEGVEVAVTLTVSKGSQMRKLPEVEDKNIDTVAESLGVLGFVVNADYQYSNEFAKDRVIAYKDYKPGDQLEDGAEVKIIVSKGVETNDDAYSSKVSSVTSN